MENLLDFGFMISACLSVVDFPTFARFFHRVLLTENTKGTGFKSISLFCVLRVLCEQKTQRETSVNILKLENGNFEKSESDKSQTRNRQPQSRAADSSSHVLNFAYPLSILARQRHSRLRNANGDARRDENRNRRPRRAT